MRFQGPVSPVEKLRWSMVSIATALSLLSLSLVAEGGATPAAGLAAAGIVAAMLHWIAGLRSRRLRPTADPTVLFTLLVLGTASGGAYWANAAVAFAFGAAALRGIYPWRLPLALTGYGLVLLGTRAYVLGPAAALAPPTVITVAAMALTGALLGVVLRASQEHEEIREELGRAKREMARRVAARTRELGEANASLRQKVREVEMTESLLRSSEEYFRALIENGSDLLVLLRPDGRIRYHSPSVRRVLGYDADDLWDRSLTELVHEEDLAPTLELLNGVLEASGRSAPLSLRVRAKDGSHRHLEAMAQNLLEDSAVGGLVVSARDVTDRWRMEETVAAQEAQLRQAQKMEAVGRLAGGVAHDFNNILTVIGGHAEYMADRIDATDPLHGEAVEIGDAVRRAARLTRQLLVFSRCEVAQPRMLDVNESVESVRKLARRLVPEGVELVARLRSRRWRVLADAGHLEQVVMNLVVNARDAVGERGRITVETSDEEVDALIHTPLGDIQPGPRVVVTVRDDGCGIAPEIRDRIFDPFFTTKGSSGTGLGLSTVFGIVRDAGAVITVESAVGEGSAFRIHFPGHDAPAAVAAAAAPDELGPVVSGETLLYVEDEDRLRALTTRALRDQGYLVLSAADGADALRMAELYRDPIDLLLTDVAMPGLTGPELLERLEEARGRVPVLFVSGYPGEELARRGVRGGGLLPKPYGSRELLREVRRVLDEG